MIKKSGSGNKEEGRVKIESEIFDEIEASSKSTSYGGKKNKKKKEKK